MTKVVPIGENQIEYAVEGDGQPVVVFLNGANTHMRTWRKVTAKLGENGGTFLCYNRLGIGESNKPTVAQSGDVVIDTLQALLERLALQPPYLLVAHSIGGLYANLFARSFPEDVSGVVLVDSSHPEQEERFAGHVPAIARAMAWYLKKVLPFSEMSTMDATAHLIRKEAAFPEIPLGVVSAGKKSVLMKKSLFDIHSRNQQELVQLSRLGHQIIAENSGHYVQQAEPELVAGAIRQVAQQAGMLIA